jgi:Phosphotransferase enzyme family
MQVTQQPEREEWRVVVPRHGASEFLVSVGDTRFSLPRVDIQPRCRVAQNLTAEIARRWDWRVVCLFSLSSSRIGNSDLRCRYHVVEALRPDAQPPVGMAWKPLAALTQEAFTETSDFVAISKFLGVGPGENRIDGPFSKLGWFPECQAWAQDQIRQLGLHLTGDFQQLNASPEFSLIRFETDGPVVWFKAVGAPNLQEFPISLTLANLFTGFVPRIIGSRKEWNAWLSLQAEGSHLDGDAESDAWTRAAEALASLQLESFGKGLHLLDAGCRDVRICSLLGLVDPFVLSMNELMGRQTKASPPPLSHAELVSLGAEIKCHFEEMEKCDIPNTLGHLDLNPGNILVSRERCVFLDWAEACVGNPFFTFQYLLEHFRRLCTRDSIQEIRLISAYRNKWRPFLSPRDLDTAFRLSPLLAVFACTADRISRQDLDLASHSVAGGYLRALARRMKREADALRGRFICVP